MGGHNQSISTQEIQSKYGTCKLPARYFVHEDEVRISIMRTFDWRTWYWCNDPLAFSYGIHVPQGDSTMLQDFDICGSRAQSLYCIVHTY